MKKLLMAVAAVAAFGAFGKTYYVDGSVEASGDGSKDSPFKTVEAGIAAAVNAGDVVEIAKGTYTLTAIQTLSKAITVKGATGNRDDVTVSGGGKYTCFKFAGAGATVANLTIANGTSSAGQSGGCVNFAALGVVSNCVIKGGALYNSGCAIAAYVDKSSLIIDSVIKGNTAYFNGAASGGMVVHVASGSLVRTLVVGNGKGNIVNFDDPSIVSLNSGLIDHCTIANNTCAKSALFVNNSTACTVRDTIVWGNTAIRETRAGAPNVSGIGASAKISHLCTLGSFGTDPVNGNPSFVDQANGDYSLSAASPCIGAGTDGSDIGAVPYDATKGTVGMSVSAYGGNDSVEVTHTLVAGGGWTLDGATVRWAFDGRALAAEEEGDATGTEVTHTYAAGVYSPTAYVLMDGAAEEIKVSLPKTIDVRWTGTADVSETSAKSLAELVKTAGDGATVNVAEGTYPLTECLNVVKSVKIVGTGSRDNTKITSTSRCF